MYVYCLHFIYININNENILHLCVENNKFFMVQQNWESLCDPSASTLKVATS